MTKADFQTVTHLLHGLYGERFPGLTPEMAQLWYDDLQPCAFDLVTRAVKRWARQHTLKAPSLDELLEAVEWIEEQDRKSRLPSVTPVDPIKVLLDAQARFAAAAPSFTTADSIWGKLMVRLLELATRHEERYTLADCAAQCLTWAEYYRTKSAELTGWLERQSTQYQQLAAQVKDQTPVRHRSSTMPRLGESREVSIRQEPCAHAEIEVATGCCRHCGEVPMEPAA